MSDKKVDYMNFKKNFSDVCSYCEYETGDYCSRCGRALSESAKVLEHKLKQELPKEW